MEEENAAAYYEELNRKGEGARRFKQGLGFSSDEPQPPAFTSKPTTSSSFLSGFVRAGATPAQLPTSTRPPPPPEAASRQRRRSRSPSPSRARARSRSPSRSRRRRSRSRSRSRERRRRSRSRESRWDSRYRSRSRSPSRRSSKNSHDEARRDRHGDRRRDDGGDGRQKGRGRRDGGKGHFISYSPKIPNPISYPISPVPKSRAPCAAMEESKLKAARLLEQMSAHLATDAGKKIVEKVGFVYQLNISPKKVGVDEEIFVVDLKKGAVTKGPYEGKADATFTFTDDDFLDIASGKLNPQMAFIRGKLKIKGSIGAAQKFTPDIFPKPSKL